MIPKKAPATLVVIMGVMSAVPTAAQRPAAPATRTQSAAESPQARLSLLHAEAADLEASRRAILAQLDDAQSLLQHRVRALRAGEQQVAEGTAPRTRLQPLQKQVRDARAAVEEQQRQLAALTKTQASLRSDLLRAASQAGDVPQEAAPARRVPILGDIPLLGQLFRTGAPGYSTPAGAPFTVLAARAEAEEQQAAARLQSAEAALKSAEIALAAKKEQVRAGTLPPADVSVAEASVIQAQSLLQAARTELAQSSEERQRLTRLAELQRPVDVELRDATIRQAAESIQQAARITIRVEENVPADKRLTVVARSVPLATVLDSIARQSGLLIAPHANGVSLKPMPMLEVNGQRTQLMSPFMPWSSEWGLHPAATLGGGGSFYDGYSGGGGGFVRSRGDAPAPANVPPATTVPGRGGQNVPSSVRPRTPATDAYRGRPGVAPPAATQPGAGAQLPLSPGQRVFEQPYGRPAFPAGGTTVTALSANSFVVAHPAATPAGEPAVMLTVYRLDGAQLRMVSSTLHRLGPAQAGQNPGRFGNRSRRSSQSEALNQATRERPRPSAEQVPVGR